MRTVSARNRCAKLLTLFIIGLGVIAQPAKAQTEFNLARDVSLDQKLDEQVPLDIPFKDETGKAVRIGDYFGKKPTLLMLPFYRCKGSCALELEGLLLSLNKVDFTTSKEFDVVIVSIHPKETPEHAAAKKREMMKFYKKSGVGASGWHLLTGDWDSIMRLTKTVGFKFVYNEQKDQIAHPAGLMLLTPQGKVSRYFYGVNYKAQDVRLAVVEAGENKIGSLVDKVILYCSPFDMHKGKYTLSFVRLLQVAGCGTVLFLAILITILAVQNRRVPLYKEDIAKLKSQTPKQA
ncbi:MAG: SCO family protein [Armatimonadetes bacterium]|nr:SCO family protein [Armatimonadota bacterium]